MARKLFVVLALLGALTLASAQAETTHKPYKVVNPFGTVNGLWQSSLPLKSPGTAPTIMAYWAVVQQQIGKRVHAEGAGAMLTPPQAAGALVGEPAPMAGEWDLVGLAYGLYPVWAAESVMNGTTSYAKFVQLAADLAYGYATDHTITNPPSMDGAFVIFNRIGKPLYTKH